MRAICISTFGGPEVLLEADIPRPNPGSEELLVEVAAAGLNRADVLQRRGQYPPPPGVREDVPGLEFAGTVREMGSAVKAWAPGDRAMGLVSGGAYAQYVTVHATHAVPIPAAWSFAEAAAVPEAFLTAHDALSQAQMEQGDAVLIHAVGSSVGTAALQIARAGGGTVAGTSRTADKLAKAKDLGLDHPLLVEGEFLPPVAFQDWADVVCDLVGGSYFAGTIAATAPKGRIVVVGLTAGRTAALDLGHLLRKRLMVIGTAMRSRSCEEKAAVVRSFREVVLPMFDHGDARPVLDRTFPMTAASEAHWYLETNQNFGSVVLLWS
ncbi:MAG: NAD(P)H-quinone oxidoreductase [Gemmatimonadota bacterium]|nr:NAD(P)H-quinone oxidoreductase [Gemmatimonadota bacterium]